MPKRAPNHYTHTYANSHLHVSNDYSTFQHHPYSGARLDDDPFSPGSNAADDERSPSPLNLPRPNMRPHNPSRNNQSYDGEDTRTTSSKELAGWYSYGWAAEVSFLLRRKAGVFQMLISCEQVFVVCGVGKCRLVGMEWTSSKARLFPALLAVFY